MNDERLRLLALAELGTLAPAHAREALEAGVLELEPRVLTWTGSLGPMAGHRVVLWLEPALREVVVGDPGAVDALTAAIAVVIGRWSGNALAELEVLDRPRSRPRGSPYRDSG